jgi:foldase protein PrsA
MKKWIVAGVMISSLGLSACSSNAALKTETGNSNAVMKSDAGNITQDELYQAMKSKYGVQTLQQLAIKKVLSKEYKVSNSEIDSQVKKIKDQLGGQFLSTIQQYGYQNENDYRNAILLNLLEKKAVYKTIKVTEKELQDAYTSYKPDIQARHILVGDEKTANEIETKLSNGAKFEDMVKQYSKDPGTVSNGGNLGWFGTGEMDQAFEKAAFSLKINQISTPVKTQYGYNIIQVTDIKPKETFEKMKVTLSDQVKQSKFTQDALQKVLKAEFKKENVSISDKDLEKVSDLTAFSSH